jgi:hypothetical protein
MGTKAVRGLRLAHALPPAAALALLLSGCSQQDPSFTEDTQRRTVDDMEAVGAPGPQTVGDMAGGEGNTDGVGKGSGDGGFVDANGDGIPDANTGDGNGVCLADGCGSGDGGDDTTGDDAGDDDGTGSEGDPGNGTGADDDGTGADDDGTGTDDDGTGTDDDGTGTDDDGTGADDDGTGTDDDEGGINTQLRTVEVTQQGPGKVDILWVVDTSGSMAEEQQYLANNFNALISQLQAAGTNFQTAVTTTDVCDNSVPGDLAQRRCPVDYGGSAATHLRGSFVGTAGRKVLKQGDGDLIAKFNEYTRQGVDASGFEHGLEAAHMAVDKVVAGTNEDLIRDDAFLAVIVVSDEQDDGIGLWETDAYHGHNFAAEGLTTFKYTENDMISYLQGVKGAGKFSISTITGTRNANGSMCSAAHSQPAEEGTQYIKAAQKSGGIVQSICETNWSASLATIGLDLNAQITQVVLPSAPDVPTITVKVNGVVTTQWTYNAGNNAVKFNAGHVPAEGAVIKVTYYEQ